MLDEKDIFSKNAIEAIHRYFGRYPRMINILADDFLLLGFSKVKNKITARMVKQGYEDMSLNVFSSPSGQEARVPYEITKTKTLNVVRYWK